ncbi:hypothetical protein ABID19_004358 [Mesorhizobium robiniae]|uniref:Lysozyme n=1 Tax=Mesorhizobium robiniae TaxID=559315 RepID=A0ABV2GT57_9HYPH
MLRRGIRVAALAAIVILALEKQSLQSCQDFIHG